MRRDNVAVHVQLRKLNLTNTEQVICLQTNNNKKPTLKCHRKPAGTDCLWCLSTPHELKLYQ